MSGPADWNWALSNIGPAPLMLWLEPWADEVAVPGRSTVTLRIENGASGERGLDIDDSGEHLVVWAAGGDRIEVAVDGVVVRTGSAVIAVPDAFGMSPKRLLGVLFDEQPSARLAGRAASVPRPLLWRRLLRRLGF
jgi:hypothetical protein